MTDIPTNLGPTLRVSGELNASEDITVSGHVQGRIHVPDHHVIVAESGNLSECDIIARELVIQGNLSGDARAGHRIEVGAQASVQGRLAAPRVLVVEGATINGSIDTKDTEAAMSVARYRMEKTVPVGE
jgi:cytoskeletal protein CcmA (bactofilin family)